MQFRLMPDYEKRDSDDIAMDMVQAMREEVVVYDLKKGKPFYIESVGKAGVTYYTEKDGNRITETIHKTHVIPIIDAVKEDETYDEKSAKDRFPRQVYRKRDMIYSFLVAANILYELEESRNRFID